MAKFIYLYRGPATPLANRTPAEDAGRATALAAAFAPQEHDRLANAVMSP